MDLHKVRVFLAVVQAGSFSAAAARLGYAQPSVSAHVQDLERQLRIPLFERRGRGVRPTDAGLALADYATRIFALERDATRALDAIKGLETGRLLVGASTSPGTYLLPAILGRFHRAHPAVEVRLEISDTARVEERVLALDIDLGVIGEPIAPEQLVVEPWQSDELTMVVGTKHAWARRAPRARDLEDEPFLMREPGSSIRALTDRWFAERGLTPSVAMELSGTDAVLRAVAAGLGITFTTRLALPFRGLVEVPLQGLPIARRLNLIHSARKPMLPAPARLREMMLGGARG